MQNHFLTKHFDGENFSDSDFDTLARPNHDFGSLILNFDRFQNASRSAKYSRLECHKIQFRREQTISIDFRTIQIFIFLML